MDVIQIDIYFSQAKSVLIPKKCKNKNSTTKYIILQILMMEVLTWEKFNTVHRMQELYTWKCLLYHRLYKILLKSLPVPMQYYIIQYKIKYKPKNKTKINVGMCIYTGATCMQICLRVRSDYSLEWFCFIGLTAAA